MADGLEVVSGQPDIPATPVNVMTAPAPEPAPVQPQPTTPPKRKRNPESDKKWRADNKERLSILAKEYYQKNKEKISKRDKEYKRKYRQDNRERLREYRRAYEFRKRALSADFINENKKKTQDIVCAISFVRWVNECKFGVPSCEHCGRVVMSNYSVDHILPTSIGGSNHKTNLQILCPTCNSEKINKYADYREKFFGSISFN